MDGSNGRQLGPYRLISQLAVGGMAEIYRAKAAGVGGFEKLVALKVIHPNYSDDSEFVQMLVDEAKLAVHLQHANIVQTFDLGRVNGDGGDQYYIAMELIEGIDLYKLLRRSSEKDLEFPFEVAAFIAEEAAQGLDYAHRKRDERGRPLEIVHRDISPQNILVSFDGEVKIVDFGIAKAARRAKQTAAGVIKGKYYYMSPEQAWGDPIDARTDIFSTGILLYEMLVGQMLYLEEDMDVLLDKVRKAAIPKPSTKRKDVPAQLESIVMKALAKRPQERFQTAGELATALGRFVRARAPEFNRSRLVAWVKQVLGDEPVETDQPRDPKLSTAVRRAEIERDRNSLLFKLDELKKPTPVKAPKPQSPKPQAAKPQANAPKPRRGDQATSPVKMPELAAAAFADYEENEATIVDGSADTLMALTPRENLRHDEEESTRPMGPSQLRQMATGKNQLDDDPAADTEFDDPDEPGEQRVDSSQILMGESLADSDTTEQTSLEKLGQNRRKPEAITAKPLPPRVSQPMNELPELPGVRSPPGLYDESGPLGGDTPQDDEEATAVAGPGRAKASPWPPNGNQPVSALSGPQMMPLPSGLPVLGSSPPQPRQPLPERDVFASNPSSSGRFTTDAVIKSLQPARSRLALVLIGAALLAAATVALLSTGPSTPSKATIEVVSSPAGAEVRIDGTAIQQPTPLVITDVDPTRPHHVVVSKKGPPLYDPWESDVKFDGPEASRQVRLQAILVPVVATLDISSNPAGAEAIVNGRIAGETPTTVSDLSPSDEVVVELRLRGYRVARRSFAFGGKRKLEVAIPLEKAR
jgi:serine/threonine protein kinase